MLDKKEECKKCGRSISYVRKEGEDFCPECGWSRKAAEERLRDQRRDARKYIRASFLKAGFFFLLSGVFAFLIYEEALKCVRLARSGEEAVLTVVSLDNTVTHYRRRRGTVTTYTYTIEYAGYRTSLDTELPLEVSGQYYVIHLPEDKKVFIFGTKSDTVFSLLWREVGLGGLLVTLIVFVTASWYIWSGIRALAR